MHACVYTITSCVCVCVCVCVLVIAGVFVGEPFCVCVCLCVHRCVRTNVKMCQYV